MKKISTLFKKDPNNLARIIDEINPENEWAIAGGIATRKYDGTASAIINGEIYKRYDVKKGREVPANAVPCQDPDAITGHWPHWVKCDRQAKDDKWHFEAFDNGKNLKDGTYELVGPKINGNPESLTAHILIPHGEEHLIVDTTYNGLKSYLEATDIEGIVFHAKDGSGRMCKIRKSDFGIKRGINPKNR